MNQEEKNRAYVQETFGEMHAPESLRRKVMNMGKNEAKKCRMSVVKKLAVAAAVAVVLFAGSNGVAYAMTGSTWIKTVTAKMNIDGIWQDVELEGEMLEDGTVQYSTTVEVPDGNSVGFVLVTDSDSDVENVVYNMDTNVVPSRTEVVEEDDRIYFVDDDVKIDITEDMEDGHAAGSFERNGVICQYEVKEEPGVPGCYELHITSGEE